MMGIIFNNNDTLINSMKDDKNMKVLRQRLDWDGQIMQYSVGIGSDWNWREDQNQQGSKRVEATTPVLAYIRNYVVRVQDDVWPTTRTGFCGQDKHHGKILE